MCVIHKVNPVQVNNSQIGGGAFKPMYVNYFIDFLLLFFHFLVGANQVENFQAVDKIVDFSHKTLHKDDLRETNAKILQLGGECLEFAEVVKLHCSGKVQQHMSEVRAFIG